MYFRYIRRRRRESTVAWQRGAACCTTGKNGFAVSQNVPIHGKDMEKHTAKTSLCLLLLRRYTAKLQKHTVKIQIHGKDWISSQLKRHGVV